MPSPHPPAGPTRAPSRSSSTTGTTAATTAPTRTASTSQQKVHIEIGQASPGSPADPITVRATGGTLRSVSVALPDGVTLDGGFGAGKTSWATSTQLGYGKSYLVTADAAARDGSVVHTAKTVRMVDPGTLSYPNFVPQAGQSNIGVGQPLRVRFTVSPADKAAAQRALSVKSTPAQPGAWYWIDSQTVDYRPRQFWRPRTTITLSAGLYGVNLGGGVYGQTSRTATYQVHDKWEADADGALETMKIYHNDRYVTSMKISMGSPDDPTHVGIHVISEKDTNKRMCSCTLPGGAKSPGEDGYYNSDEHFANRISNDGEFVHENPRSVDAQGVRNVSHGCINLDAADAQWFYSHFSVGDVVVVGNSGGSPLPLYDLWGDWTQSLTWNDWVTGNTAY